MTGATCNRCERDLAPDHYAPICERCEDAAYPPEWAESGAETVRESNADWLRRMTREHGHGGV